MLRASDTGSVAGSEVRAPAPYATSNRRSGRDSRNQPSARGASRRQPALLWNAPRVAGLRPTVRNAHRQRYPQNCGCRRWVAGPASLRGRGGPCPLPRRAWSLCHKGSSEPVHATRAPRRSSPTPGTRSALDGPGHLQQSGDATVRAAPRLHFVLSGHLRKPRETLVRRAKEEPRATGRGQPLLERSDCAGSPDLVSQA